MQTGGEGGAGGPNYKIVRRPCPLNRYYRVFVAEIPSSGNHLNLVYFLVDFVNMERKSLKVRKSHMEFMSIFPKKRTKVTSS